MDDQGMLTDPATELADLCDSLSGNENIKGAELLSQKFGVEINSRDFYWIIEIVLARIAHLKRLIESLEIEPHQIEEAKNDLDQLAHAFAVENLFNNWKGAGGPHFLRRENTRFIRGLSSTIRRIEPYPRLSDDEISDLLGMTKEIENHLSTLQTSDRDFIRSMIISGISEFRFCIEHLRWIGWAHTLKSVEQLFHAYMVLERKMPDDFTATSARTTLRLLKSLLEEIIKKAERGKAFWELGRFYLEAVGVQHLLTNQALAALPSPPG